MSHLNKTHYFVIVLILCFGAYYLNHSSSKKDFNHENKLIPGENTTTRPPLISDKSKVFTAEPKASVDTPNLDKSSPSLKLEEISDNAPRPKDLYSKQQGWIDFEVKESWAITQEDIIIGKPVPGENYTTGRSKTLKTLLWPSNQIPYSVQENVTNLDPIKQAIKYFNDNTPVKFIPYTDEPDSIVFVASEALCASYLGQSGGHQPILLSSKCGTHEVIHELMHALGFVHEQSRVDRDEFIEIKWENILPGLESQFAIFPDNMVHQYHGTVFYFDYQSIMLYPETSFAKNKKLKTLVSITSEQVNPTQDGLSKIDIERLIYLYGN